MKGILGRKVGMTQVFTTHGKLIPVTVIEAPKNVITQIKIVEKDGYNAIQIGAFNKKEKASNRKRLRMALEMDFWKYWVNQTKAVEDINVMGAAMFE